MSTAVGNTAVGNTAAGNTARGRTTDAPTRSTPGNGAGQYLATLQDITVDEDRRGASVGGHRITAETERQLRSQLSVALYDHLHAGRTADDAGHQRPQRDESMEALLGKEVGHRYTSGPALLVRPAPRPGPEGTVLIEHAGLRVWAPLDAVNDGRPSPVGAVVPLRVSAHRPTLSPGFYLVDGARGATSSTQPLLRLYLHARTAQDAVTLWGLTIDHLHAADLAYRAKVLSSSAFYPRQDSIVVYLPKESWPALAELVAAVERSPDELRGAATSRFAERLGRGIALAAEPSDATRPGLSFGQHRALVAAGALIETADHTDDLATVLTGMALAAGIDPDHPWRNTDTPHVHL
ncbi:hypothetical protein ABIB25_001670 [Nakamurella sp. UYEF19]|uniref:T3SS effector HopA1 family protein n=1 Tax=Nakamurella sp. UYEF19 TaxID=1756392 RepID=UPI0033966121